MTDPLSDFNWETLYTIYDHKCYNFHPDSPHLRGIKPAPTSDRALYYALLTHAQEGRSRITVDWYEAMVYWKLYSQNRSGVISWLRGVSSDGLSQLIKQLPPALPRQAAEIIRLVELIGTYRLPGTASGLPVRTAFLHFLYPDTMPIFDQMVLKAVGVSEKNANQRIEVLTQYIPHAWGMADRHAKHTGLHESPIRLVDMALWVERG
jgi:hypothetical protein